ncbi:hypothetical protein SAMN06264364_102198 [Quadrisphaera granulorum]|uniref:SPW repeat-containing protein n=1 Tax=Quadrisphaera granulorum TaxID=317664 RepID=A0A316ADZ5_9ACTN|nr:hypothetical protein [Quadrisphaera granulorum]PWJ55832.1 hypothetical protein BXY45_102198 [Quadrisphaera granulorum]SZE95329.1 hypothetical protein SAMN06264364_102198 [Quadrisphaera granulorum]
MKRSAALVTGLVLNALSGLAGLPTLVDPTMGPAPLVINVVTGVLGIITLVGVVLVWRWRSGRVGLGVTLIVVSQALNVLTAVPAFFADIPVGYKAAIAVGVVLTAVGVVLVLPARRAASELTASPA